MRYIKEVTLEIPPKLPHGLNAGDLTAHICTGDGLVIASARIKESAMQVFEGCVITLRFEVRGQRLVEIP
jgi:hypothetical protein